MIRILLGAVLTAFFVSMALVALVWTPNDPTVMNIAERLGTPSQGHWLGTDLYGRDILSMLMVGAGTSLSVALVALGIGAGIGVPLGLTAALKNGGLIDEIIMRLGDLVFAFPALVIAILITALAGPGAINAIIAIGIFNIPVFARVARAGALSILARDFILAAKLAGKGSFRIGVEHVLPNISGILIVQATIQFSLGILAEAGLSYVGLGAQPPLASWGRMLADAQTLLAIAPHTVLIPGFTIIAAVLGLNLLGDGLRDWLDPKLTETRS